MRLPLKWPVGATLPWTCWSQHRAALWRMLIVVGAVACVLACRPQVDRGKADSLAAARLQEYIRAERLNPEQLGRPEVRNQDAKWLYTYEYYGAPKQSVAVTVFADGHVELSRMLR
jgi:prepilin-type processing-associated H-X9-DG protein